MKTWTFTLCLLVTGPAHGAPSAPHEISPDQGFVDIVGDVDGTLPATAKATIDTVWIATWNFEGCDDTGWVRSDNRILNDGNIYWHVDDRFDGIANIAGNAAECGQHNICWDYCHDGYDNNWHQGIFIQYVGDSFLSFDFLVDSENGFDVLQVETDSACTSFDQVDYDVDPTATAAEFRDVIWSVSGLDTVTARVDSIALSGYATADTHCAYVAFFSDGVYNSLDFCLGLGVAAVVDNVLLEGAIFASEDFSEFTPSASFQFVNLLDTTPFGTWARTFEHITDNDLCTENTTCAWLSSDDTTPTIANHPSMAFGPSDYVIRNWLDEVLIGPWVSLTTTATAIGTVVQFNRFPGNFFATSRIAHNWSIRSRSKVANTDTPGVGDSIDCVSHWGHGSQWNSLSTFEWLNLTWDATADFNPYSSDVQVRLRLSDWQHINNALPPTPFQPGPGPYVDRLRIGRQFLGGPVINDGTDGRYQAQDAAPNDPAFPSGPMYAQLAGGDIFGTTAFSRSADLGTGNTSTNLIVGDSITVEVQDILENGELTIDFYAAIVAGPHAGKSPAPYLVGPNGFFSIPADQSRYPWGGLVADNYFVDMDDTYFRGGDVLRYFWWATDGQGGTTSNPVGLSALPSSMQEAEALTGGLFEVNFLPSINWDAGYLARIAADAHGDLDPTPQEIAISSQRNCILYCQIVNTRRRSSDLNRTSFMYTLDKLGYRGHYDVYDQHGLGNTNNQLGSRMSPEQARNYSVLVYDAGNNGPGAPILPDGVDLDAEKIDMESWFQSWNALSGIPNAAHTLWIMGSQAMEEKPLSPLYTVDMAAVFTAPNQLEDLNPDVFGVAGFTNHLSCDQDHTGDQFALHGGCPTIRDYDDLAASGSGVVTHRYGKGVAGSPGAIVMHANAAGYTTVLSSFPWFDVRAGVGQSPEKADTALLSKILACALPVGCHEAVDPTDVGPRPDGLIDVPAHNALHQNSPNPFNPTTTITFDLARDGVVSLKIYDVAGRLVRSLRREPMRAGFDHRVAWNGLDDAGRPVASGVYLSHLETSGQTATRKMVVVR